MLAPVCLDVRGWVYLYVCTYKRVFATLVYLHISDYDCPFRRICTRLAPNYSSTFTHPQAQTHTSARILCTHSHTRLIISSCWSVTLPLLLLTSQEYAVAYASLFRWFFMLLLRLVYGLHYMPYHALTLINAHSRAYFAHFGRAHGARREGKALSSLYSSRFPHVYYVKFMRVCCIWILYTVYTLGTHLMMRWCDGSPLFHHQWHQGII